MRTTTPTDERGRPGTLSRLQGFHHPKNSVDAYHIPKDALKETTDSKYFCEIFKKK